MGKAPWEMVRRAEYALGKAIRKGQAEDAVRRNGQRIRVGNQYAPAVDTGSSKPGPSDFISPHEWSGNGGGVYQMTDDGVTEERFDAAIDEAKAEGNLSRANVVRKRWTHGYVYRDLRNPLMMSTTPTLSDRPVHSGERCAGRSISLASLDFR